MANRVIAICPSKSQGLQDYSENLYSELDQQIDSFCMLCHRDYMYADKNPSAHPTYDSGPISDVFSTITQIYKFDPDVVHSQSTNLGLLFTLILCRLLFNFKLVLTPHSSKSHFERPVYERFQTRIYNLFDGIIWHTEQDKERMAKTGVSTAQAVIEHGNYSFYTDYGTEITQAAAREQLGIGESTHVFLFFGYLRQDKRLDLLLESFAQLQDTQSADTTLLIAGQSIDDDLTESYLDLIDEHDLSEHVQTHIGFVENEDVPIYFEAADTLVTPYDTISESGVVHIGLAFGLPVIATDVEGFAETFEEGKNGLLVPPDSQSRLTDAMEYTIDHKPEMREMGEYNRTQAEESGWEEIAQETIDFYNHI